MEEFALGLAIKNVDSRILLGLRLQGFAKKQVNSLYIKHTWYIYIHAYYSMLPFNLTLSIKYSILHASLQGNDENPEEGPGYFKGVKGNTNCEDLGALNIMNMDECKTACDELGIRIGSLKNNKACYVANNNKCRQTGRPGAKTSMICKKTGRMVYEQICSIQQFGI